MPSPIEDIKNYLYPKKYNYNEKQNQNSHASFKAWSVAIVSAVGIISAVVTIPVAIFCGVAISLYSCTCFVINTVKSFFDDNKSLTLKELLKNIFKSLLIDLPMLILITSINLFKDMTLYLILYLIDKPTFTYTKKFSQASRA